MQKIRVAFLSVLVLAPAAFSQQAAAIETRLLSRLANIEKWSNYGESPDEKKLEIANENFKQELLRSTKAVATLKYAFPRLRKEMHIVTSKDGRLRLYSWDMQTGGSMHEYASICQFRGHSGKVYSVEDDGGGFYHDIFQLNGSAGNIYLRVSTFIASGSLIGESLDVSRVQGERLVRNVSLIRTTKGLTDSVGFEYDFSSVMDRDERPVKLFKFNEADRSFSFPVVIADDETPQGRVTGKQITYRYNGRHFVKVG